MFKRLVVCLVMLGLVGCGAVERTIKHGKLETQTKMSETIFLDPVPAAQQTVYIKFRNTTGKVDFDIQTPVEQSITAKGYRIVSDPTKAYYVFQANVLSVGKKTEDEINQEILGGFGSALKGLIAGAAMAGSMNNYSTSSMTTGAIVGGAVGWVADNMVEVVWQTITTDLQITEKNGKKHQTRVVSIAKKTNLKLEEALPQLTQELGKSISGML